MSELLDEETNILTSDDFEITSNFTSEEYERSNWSERLCSMEEKNDFEERQKVFHKLYDYIWNLLFGTDATLETRNRAIHLLIMQRCDAAFYEPYIYNDWIRSVKAEIIKREMFDFWENEIVKNELGLFYYRNCDLFDMGDVSDVEEFNEL
ncbi:uncharacterized protein LOC129940522 [Eupeodes corollae]|uniref:uncharacterized protein LOC129940522 n=1 Tax=Eupeodes corollae TaxID=290404 RepID=UPI0024910AC1|nr:uncharacterized protein LOC129940522 [Eupeodes corollae]